MLVSRETPTDINEGNVLNLSFPKEGMVLFIPE